MMFFAIPLAWLQLKRERVRLLVAIAGISFAVILMFMQLGFRDALFDSAVRFHSSLQGDIFLLNPKSTALIAMTNFSDRRLYQAASYPGVESFSPIYLDFGIWTNPAQTDRNTRSILVIGVNPEQQIFDISQLADNPQRLEETQRYLDQITLSDVLLFDRESRPEFGQIACWFRLHERARGKSFSDLEMEQITKDCGVKTVADLDSVEQEFFGADGPKVPVTTEVSNRRVTVGGLFALGASFGADGNALTSDLNFLRIFSRRRKGTIDIGLIKLEPNVDVNQVLTQMRPPTAPIGEGPLYPVRQLIQRFGGPPAPEARACFADATDQEKQNWPRCLCRLTGNAGNIGAGYLPPDVCALSKTEFVAFEKYYWQTSTTIGFIFAFGTAMGFMVGTIIVYQILYTDVTDHLAEYATLKAMGYRNRYLLSVVFQEALILAVLGFIPGVVISTLLYNTVRTATKLPIAMGPGRALMILFLAMLMCVISGTIAVRKVQSADPAEIF
ncbi:MAG: FtsX-like permease family protein [Leptolyngbyaceae cyanobacterium bins.59]|nr:FtsX-like permease family protein [Leptolyngbyaceae cyanobacterium bins.59]